MLEIVFGTLALVAAVVKTATDASYEEGKTAFNFGQSY
jgi:hypothetical protein